MIRFCLGVASVAFWPLLPPAWCTVLLLVVTLMLRLSPPLRGSIWFCLGMIWGRAYGQWQMGHRLDPALEGETLNVSVAVTGLPIKYDAHCRFEGRVTHWPEADAMAPRRCVFYVSRV